jgi:hypothetical protein
MESYDLTNTNLDVKIKLPSDPQIRADMKKKKQNTSEIYELNIRMYKVMRTPEQAADRLREIDLLIEKADLLEINEDVIEALIESKQDDESPGLNNRQEHELYKAVQGAGLNLCGINVYQSGLYASYMVFPTQQFEGLTEKFERFLLASAGLASFEGFLDVRGDNPDDSFVLRVEKGVVSLEAGKGAREDD